MRYQTILAQTGTFFQRNAVLVIPALIAAGYAVAPPPETTFGSEALEHLKDVVACGLAVAGLAWRCWLVRRAPDRVRAERTFANLLILSSIIAMHGHYVVVAAGAALVFFLFESARSVAASRHGAAGGAKPPSRAGTAPSAARIVTWELLTIGLTAGVLWLTEVYEYLPVTSVRETQLYLLIASGVLLACMLPSYVGDVLSARTTTRERPETRGPATRGIRVDGRVGSVDVLENWLSFGSLESILQATLAAAALRPGDRLVDVGCGTGKLAIVAAAYLQRAGGGGDALGVDATPGMIDLARQRAFRDGSAARFEVGVGEKLPVADASADAVTSSYFFHHLPADVKRQALREMWRALVPGGRLVVTDYARPRSLRGWVASFPMQFNFYEYVREQLAGSLETLLRDEDLGEVEVTGVFLGYITVFRVRKALAPAERLTPRATSLSASAVPAA